MIEEPKMCGIHERDIVPETWSIVKFGSVGDLGGVVTGGRERLKQEEDQAERACWMVKSSQRYLGWELTTVGSCRL